VRESLRDALRFVSEDFAAFPRLPIVLGVLLAIPAYLLIAPAFAGPAFSVGLLAGLARASYPNGPPWP
jgi:hypothetical protein